MMQRVIRMVADLVHREPLAYAVSYVEPDGTRERDVKEMQRHANAWADWCRRDGCAEVEVEPLYFGYR